MKKTDWAQRFKQAERVDFPFAHVTHRHVGSIFISRHIKKGNTLLHTIVCHIRRFSGIGRIFSVQPDGTATIISDLTHACESGHSGNDYKDQVYTCLMLRGEAPGGQSCYCITQQSLRTTEKIFDESALHGVFNPKDYPIIVLAKGIGAPNAHVLDALWKNYYFSAIDTYVTAERDA